MPQRALTVLMVVLVLACPAQEELFERGLFAAAALQATPAALIEQDTEALWVLGSAELARSRSALATEHLEALILERPNQRHLERSLFMLGRGYAEQGDHLRAAQSYRAASRLSAGVQTRGYALYRLGESLYDAGDYAGALEAYRRMERESADDEVSWGVHFAMAQAQVQLDDLDGAIEELRAAREGCAAPPVRAQVDYWLGRTLAAAGRYEEARRSYAEARSAAHPLSDRAEFEYGLTLYILEDYTGAAESLGRISRGAQTDPPASELIGDDEIAAARYYLGWADYHLGDYAAAEALAAGLLDDGVYGSGARVLLAESALAGGDYTVGAHYFGLAADEARGGEARTARFKQGLCLYRMRDYAAAEEVFAGVAAPDGGDAASYWRAMSAMRGDAPRRAEELFLPVYAAGGSLADNALLELGDIATNTGRHRLAVERYSALLETAPAGELAPVALFSRGQAYIRAGEHQRGQNDYAALVDSFPADELADDALYLIAQAAFETGRHLEALPLFERLRDEYPRSRYADYADLRRADCHYALDEFAAARRLYADLGAATPLSEVADDALYGAELSAWRLGDYADVIEATEAYLRLRPGSYLAPELLLTIARHHRDRGDVDSACAHYRRILEEHSDSAELAAASAELARCLAESGDDAEVIALLESALDQTPAGPGRAGLHFQLARAARRGGDYNLALEHYNILIHQYPGGLDWLRANYELAGIYRELHQPGPARMALERIIAAEPSRNWLDLAHLELGFVEQEAGYESRALEHHRLAAESRDPDIAVQALFWLGELNYGIAAFDESLALFQRLVDDYGGDYPSYSARSILRRANIYERRDQPQAARRQYTKVVEGDYAQTYQDRAAERLAVLE